MDNLTHSLFGLAAGQLVQRVLPSEADETRQRTRGRMLMLSGWAASNFPDLDLLYTNLLPAPLGYLLHHRGHTHTLLYAVPQMLLLALLIWLLWPNARRLLQDSRPARLGLALCAVGGTLLHIGFDSLNSYGVHPFHPFNGRWLYGDLVFILEPVFWIAFGVPLALSLRTGWLRALLLTVLASVAGFAWAGYLLWPAVALLGAAALGIVWIDRRGRRGGSAALAAGMALSATFIGVQALSASAARAQLAGARTGHTLVDVALTAYPANPLCWSFTALERSGAGARVLRGALSAAPALLPVARCPAAIEALPADATAVALTWQLDVDLQALRRQTGIDCQFASWMRFARIPALYRDAATDVRFGPHPSSNFSTVRFTEGVARPCPAGVPGWDMPRADLLK